MDTSPCPHLDEVIWRLRQLPEIEELLKYGYNGEQTLPAPSISVPGLTDVSLIIRLQASTATYFNRLSYVAGGSSVTVRAMHKIEDSLTVADVSAIRAEYGAAPVIDSDSPDRPNPMSDVVVLIMERLLLTDEQFQRRAQLEEEVARHVRNKGR
jgi:hypothetical protein